MNYICGAFKVTDKKQIAKDIYDMRIHTPEVANIASAGQFIHIKADGFFLRRPISICEIYKSDGEIRIVFEIRGKGTREIAKIEVGEDIDIMAPLGNGFDILASGSKAILIGGGVGTPPMLELSRIYGENSHAIIGFRTADKVMLSYDFAKNGSTVQVCTEDGTTGHHGFVTEPLKEYLKQEKPNIIYACGPRPMLAAVIDIAKEYGIRCQVSLEERMGCGVGACLGCACRTVKDGEEHLTHVCKDGPVYESDEVIL